MHFTKHPICVRDSLSRRSVGQYSPLGVGLQGKVLRRLRKQHSQTHSIYVEAFLRVSVEYRDFCCIVLVRTQNEGTVLSVKREVGDVVIAARRDHLQVNAG